MISQWDILSRLDSNTGSIRYSLLIDGTEHDARLIAKKLKGYVQAPQPALAPYVYRFELPMDLDESTLEKLRVAVQEGIEQAKKVNEFVPGGSLENPLFNTETSREDKDFPTFVTLDPSASMFRNEQAPTSDIPEDLFSSAFFHKEIDLSNPEDTVPSIAKTDRNPVEPPIANLEFTRPPIEEPVNMQLPSSESAEQTIPTPTEQELPFTDQDMLIKDMEGTLLDKAPAGNPEQSTDAAKESLTQKEISQELPAENTVQTPVPAPLISEPQQPLEDIFLAETKYDIFVDIHKDMPTTNTSATTAAQATAPKPVRAETKSSDDFNIFEQKIKDQTAFIDFADVSNITGNITQKDWGFVQHSPTIDMTTDTPPVSLPSQEPLVVSPSVEEEEQVSEEDEVMDPFEQLLAATTAAAVPPKTPGRKQPFQQETSADTSSALTEDNTFPPENEKPQVSAQTISIVKSAVSDEKTTLPDQEVLDTVQFDHTITDLDMFYTENQSMTKDNQGANKAFHLKRKSQQPPQVPAAPQPPAVAQPAIPPVPVAPAPVAPQAPKTTQAIPPAPKAPQPQPVLPPPPQEELHRTLMRKRVLAQPVSDKTLTIDHAELPFADNWPLEMPLIPTYTLENMSISVNRFAHATAISVIENPGKLYNPLVLHGASGTGKTHFLHAIGYALSKKYGQENVFITNGVRLSRGIQRYITEGKIAEFEAFTSSIKALLIDDIHLISINEQNRVHLSKLLNDFRAQQKQIVITSKYPPENLAKLEELLNFKLDSGWISELKKAAGTTRLRIIQKMLLNNGINITNDDAERFFGQPNMSLGTVVRSIRRVRVLEKLIFPHVSAEKRSALSIFNNLLASNGEDRGSLISQKSIDEISNVTIEGHKEWGRIGFFYPQNCSNMMNWLLFSLQQRAKELGIPGGLELAVRSSYSTENIISSAFKIANLCDNKKLKGAVILGPSLDICEASVRENFYDILTHMLEVMLIRCGIMDFEDVSSPSTYVKILAELLR